MMISRFRSLVVLLLVLLSMTAAAQSPRVAPTYDDFAAAKTLKPGKAYTVADPGAATAQLLEPDNCGNGAFNTVWFTFTPDTYGTLYLSTAGSLLEFPLGSSFDTVLAVYNGTDMDTLSEEACSDDGASVFGELKFDFLPGETYKIQVGTFADVEYADSSYYRLTSRVLELFTTPANNGFESDLGADNWTLKNESDDGRVCSDVSYPAESGACAFKFTGGTEERSKLTQTVDIPASYKLRPDGVVSVGLYVRGLDSLVIGNSKIVATFVYSDGTPSSKLKLNFTGGDTTNASYSYARGVSYLSSAKLSQIKLKAVSKATEGTLLLDSIFVYYGSGSHVRAPAGVLPLPQAPQ